MQNKTRKKRITTVSDILTQDDVKDAINTLIEKRAEITDLVYVYRDRQGMTHVNYGESDEVSVFLLEKGKSIIMMPETEENL